MTDLHAITAISPIDGRYYALTEDLAADFSEYGLIRARVRVEVEWLLFLAERPEIADVRAFTEMEQVFLRHLVAEFDPAQAERVKEIEATTRHDVKAVEYYLRERLAGTTLADAREFIHFCCTSEDINNLAYGLMLQGGIRDKWLPRAHQLADRVADVAGVLRDQPMLARTHGQPASPTTLGKEMAVFVHRWRRQLAQLERAEYLGKFSGTVGNYHTHSVAYPDAPWEDLARAFVERLGLTWNPLTTQIEAHDWIAELAHGLIRFNTITLDFDQDVWTYISLGYFKQKVVRHEVGSSTMPHKVNPINFENSEANLGVSNALLSHLATKLPVSRLQRDLTDSSALRNVGTAVAHSSLAIQSALRGIGLLEVSPDALRRDLEDAWEVLAEPIQTVMRRVGIEGAYEQLKELTRGAGITREAIQEFVRGLDIPAADKERLLALTPSTYLGLAPQLVKHVQSA
ncbi:MAG: adenylosuccinate lyase [Armatimonadetes bacterium]|nr:adenylosuccinate lyase [Armatimonadota bacterium]